MLCPECDGQTTVIDHYERVDGTTYRRRECLWCGLRFSTTEGLMTPKKKETTPDETGEPAVLQCTPKRRKVQPWGLSDLRIALRTGAAVADLEGNADAQAGRTHSGN